MRKQDTLNLFHYDRWATGLLLEAAAFLTPEEYNRDVRCSFRSLAGTLVHIFGAEKLWLSRWTGQSLDRLPAEQDFPELALLSAEWMALWDRLGRFLDVLNEEQLAAPLAYSDLKGHPYKEPLGHQVQHLFNHSTYHRGQVVTLLRQLGQHPPSTDLIRFYRLLQQRASG